VPSDERQGPADPQSNRLRVLADTAHVFAEASNDVERLLATVARRFADLIGDGCYVRLLAGDGVRLEPVATYHPDPDIERYLRETTDSIPLRLGEGISGKVVETGEPVLIPVVSFEQYRKMTKPEFVPIFEKVGVTSLIVVRLRARGINLGFIALVRNGVGRPAYTEDDLQLVLDLADRAALAIDNGRLVQELEARVRERTAELQGANADLEAFCYSVSHDLRAPLRAIDGFAQMLDEDHGAEIGADGQRVIGVIRTNAQRMGRLIDDLLRFSRLGRQALRSDEVSMAALVEELVEELRAAEPDRQIDFRIGDLPPVTGDHGLLRQVWENLLSNAVKYTGRCPVATIEISGAIAGEERCYTVRDNGAGFDPLYAAKLFGVFERLHRQTEFEGTGVGLALVERIVKKHGGRVWAEGRLNEGATFGFALPARR
jgi:signal transduction histidine kinase